MYEHRPDEDEHDIALSLREIARKELARSFQNKEDPHFPDLHELRVVSRTPKGHVSVYFTTRDEVDRFSIINRLTTLFQHHIKKIGRRNFIPVVSFNLHKEKKLGKKQVEYPATLNFEIRLHLPPFPKRRR
ncbi:MAG: hypothetical protein ABH863_01985 [Candidatus Micrarchaeota archaeon]